MGALYLYFDEEKIVAELDDLLATEEERKWEELFCDDPYRAIYEYGLREQENKDSVSNFIRKLVECFVAHLLDYPGLEMVREKVEITPDEEKISRLLKMVPIALGSEYVNEEWMGHIFQELLLVFRSEIKEFNGSIALYFESKYQRLNIPERVFFHLVENRNDDVPFAFMATYTTMDASGKMRHMPLKYAMTEFEGKREQLLDLLSCLNRSAEKSAFVATLMESGEMFYPIRLDEKEAYQFLKDVPVIEEAGILCRIPNWWRKRAQMLQSSIVLGEDKPSMVGAESLVMMQPKLSIDGETVTEEEIRSLLEQTEGLAFLKGKWIEVNHARLEELLRKVENGEGTLSLFDALRLESGTDESALFDGDTIIENGEWLEQLLAKMKNPELMKNKPVPRTFQAKLRSYQKKGYTWLNYMNELGFGACLADDMGLGKTVQVLAYLERIRKERENAHILLIVPASLIGNWQKETEKFAPQMKMEILHGMGAKVLSNMLRERPREEFAFLNITTYAMAARIDVLKEMDWDVVILDEAQAIKNPGTKQTREIKKIPAKMRIAMTGTPIENDLGNLWSLFDFLNKGLLGSSKEFKDYCKRLTSHPENYAKLRNMVAPFMLRRLKTDKSIIKDLPEKMETIEYTDLSKRQIVLYRKAVSDMEHVIENATGMERRGIVLATIMKLKQICNHPDQYLGQDVYKEKESGKFSMLRELCETIYEKRERVIVFTQFKEIIPYLDEFLTHVFHQKGYVLHGGTAVKQRGKIVEAFQGNRYVPYIILSVKAGGTGLNLTKANHVIHFDRWWNPAVENQATDRAFRIGQDKNVLVHKLVCKNTIEERIDSIINSKKELAENIVGKGGESWITELSNEQLFSLMRLE